MKRTFHDNLILNRYLLSLFNQDNLEKFKQRLGDDRFEGIDNGVNRFPKSNRFEIAARQ